MTIKNNDFRLVFTNEPEQEYEEFIKAELAKSWNLAQNPETPRKSHQEFWKKYTE